MGDRGWVVVGVWGGRSTFYPAKSVHCPQHRDKGRVAAVYYYCHVSVRMLSPHLAD